MERRGTAVLGGDRTAFMATVARAVPQFVARQRRSFDSLMALPLESYRLSAAWHRYGDLTRPSDRKRYPEAEQVAIVAVQERFRIQGFDRVESLEDLFLTFVKVRGRWLVAHDGDVSDIGFVSARHLWDYGSLHRERRGRFVALGHDCSLPGSFCGSTANSLLASSEQALEIVDRHWSVPPDLRVAMFVPASSEELERLIQATFDIEEFVAFAYFTLDPDANYRFTGNRIVFNYAALASRSPTDVFRILVHELTHIATRAAAGPFIPVFVDEGLAEYVANREDPGSLSFLQSQIAAGAFDRRLPLDYEFLTGPFESIYESYQEGESAVTFLIERWGLKSFTRFYKLLGRPGIAAGTTKYHLNRALRRSIGMNFRDFEQAWADSIE